MGLGMPAQISADHRARIISDANPSGPATRFRNDLLDVLRVVTIRPREARASVAFGFQWGEADGFLGARAALRRLAMRPRVYLIGNSSMASGS
jgi:hypothetical protein